MNKKTLKFILSAALAALAFPSFLFSQEGEAGIKWGGFVKVDMFNDSRAVTAARDDMFMLYPAERKQITSAPSVITDPLAQFIYIYGNNEDLNAVRQTSITAVQTRINVTLNGPDAFGAKTKGFIEADFFGTSNSYTWLFRNRHAYVQLDWGASKLLVGQTWHPLFVAGYHPETVQFSPLVPIHPFNRSPQIRFTQDLGGGLSLNLAAIYRAYHTDTGPANNSVTTTDAYGSKYKRWADRPDLDIQLLYKSDAFDIGFTVDFNELRPYDSTVAYDDNTTATQIGNNRNKVKGMIWQIFGKFVFDKDNNGHIRFNYFKGENTYHLLMLGGYAEKSNFLLDQRNGIITNITNQDLQNLLLVLPSVTKKEYTPIKVTSYWIQPIWGKDTEYSIIYGKIENNGAKDDVRLTSTIYARGSNIKSVTALIPQVRFKSGKTIIGVMLGYFEAEYMEDDIVLQDLFEKNLGVNTQIYNYTLSTGPTTKDYRFLSFYNFILPNPLIWDSKGNINKTYKVVDYRIQASVQQNF